MEDQSIGYDLKIEYQAIPACKRLFNYYPRAVIAGGHRTATNPVMEVEDFAAVVERSTEINVMSGSEIDRSTEAGKQLLQEIEFGTESAGLLETDSSDRLYMREQINLQQRRENQHKEMEKRAVDIYRKAAAHKSTLNVKVPLMKKNGLLLHKPKVMAKVKAKARVGKKGVANIKGDTIINVDTTAKGDTAAKGDTVIKGDDTMKLAQVKGQWSGLNYSSSESSE